MSARPRMVRGSMRRTASSTRRVGLRAIACSALNSIRPPGNIVWWTYFLSFHFFPVRRILSALMTTTKSPQSSCGVKVGLCLPRSTLAMVVATRPSTLSFTSMTTQLRWTVFLLPITVFIIAPERKSLPAGRAYLLDSPSSVNMIPRRWPSRLLEQGIHVGEEVLRLGLLDFLRGGLRRAQVDSVHQFRRDVLEETRGRSRNYLAPADALPRPRQHEPLARAGHADVAEAALLFEVERAVDRLALEPLGAVQRHERDGIAGVAVGLFGIERQAREIPEQSRPKFFVSWRITEA